MFGEIDGTTESNPEVHSNDDLDEDRGHYFVQVLDKSKIKI